MPDKAPFEQHRHLSNNLSETVTNAKLLDTLIDSIDFFFGIYDFSTRVTHIYSNMRKKFLIPEYAENGAEGFIATGAVLPDSTEALRALFAELDESRTAVRRTIHMADRNGSRPWFRFSVIPIEYENDNLKFAFLFCINVTPQILAEERYKTEVKRRLGGEENLVALCCIDMYAKKIIMYDSDNSHIKPIEATPGDSMEKGVSSIISAAVREIDRQILSDIFDYDRLLKTADDAKPLSHAYLRQTQGGDYFWVTTHIRLVKDPKNDHLLLFAYTYDTNKEKIAELTLRKVVDSSYAFVGVLDTLTKNFLLITHNSKEHPTQDAYLGYEDMIAYFSDKMRPYAVDEAEFKNMIDAFSLAGVRRHLRNSELFEISVRMYDEERRIRTSKIAFSHFDSYKTQVLITRRDITKELDEDRRRRREVTLALEEARNANIEKSKLFARINRDIRNPLGEISALADRGANCGDADELKKLLSEIKTASDSLVGLLDSTKNSNQTEARQNLKYKSVNPMDIIRKIEARYRGAIKEKAINYKLTFTNSSVSYIKTDADAIEQIFSQILANSIAFTPRGGSICAVISCKDVDSFRNDCTVTVTDSGVGMSEEFLPHIFEPFSREDTSINGGGGTGLGMSIVKNHVDALGGRIQVSSKIGGGTTVTVFLPFEKGEAENDVSRFDKVKNLDAHILYCEDNALSSEITIRILESKGCAVDCVTNGKEALEAFRAAQPWAYDAIIMDIRMPVMDGLTAAREIRAIDRVDAKKIPIIAYTVNSFADDMEKSVQAGMNAHIIKPVDPTTLIETLRRLCRQ